MRYFMRTLFQYFLILLAAASFSLSVSAYQVDAEGNTALHVALLAGAVTEATVTELQGAIPAWQWKNFINHRNADGLRAMDLAARNNDVALMQMLNRNGASEANLRLLGGQNIGHIAANAETADDYAGIMMILPDVALLETADDAENTPLTVLLRRIIGLPETPVRNALREDLLNRFANMMNHRPDVHHYDANELGLLNLVFEEWHPAAGDVTELAHYRRLVGLFAEPDGGALLDYEDDEIYDSLIHLLDPAQRHVAEAIQDFGVLDFNVRNDNGESLFHHLYHFYWAGVRDAWQDGEIDNDLARVTLPALNAHFAQQIDMVVALGGDINAMDDYPGGAIPQTVFDLAMDNGDFEAMLIILQNGATFNHGHLEALGELVANSELRDYDRECLASILMIMLPALMGTSCKGPDSMDDDDDDPSAALPLFPCLRLDAEGGADGRGAGGDGEGIDYIGAGSENNNWGQTAFLGVMAVYTAIQGGLGESFAASGRDLVK